MHSVLNTAEDVENFKHPENSNAAFVNDNR